MKEIYFLNNINNSIPRIYLWNQEKFGPRTSEATSWENRIYGQFIKKFPDGFLYRFIIPENYSLGIITIGNTHYYQTKQFDVNSIISLLLNGGYLYLQQDKTKNFVVSVKKFEKINASETEKEDLKEEENKKEDCNIETENKKEYFDDYNLKKIEYLSIDNEYYSI